MPKEDLRIGVFVCDCGLNIAGTVDTDATGRQPPARPRTSCGWRWRRPAGSSLDSVPQASAAAARAEILLSTPTIEVEAITAVVDEALCKSCGMCAPVCPYGAIAWEKKQPARVISAACAGCGTCAAECQYQAIAMRHFSDQAIYAQIDAMLEVGSWSFQPPTSDPFDNLTI